MINVFSLKKIVKYILCVFFDEFPGRKLPVGGSSVKFVWNSTYTTSLICRSFISTTVAFDWRVIAL